MIKEVVGHPDWSDGEVDEALGAVLSVGDPDVQGVILSAFVPPGGAPAPGSGMVV